MNNKGRIALAQIFILVIGIVAIGYALGSEIGEVKGQTISAIPVTGIRTAAGGTSAAASGWKVSGKFEVKIDIGLTGEVRTIDGASATFTPNAEGGGTITSGPNTYSVDSTQVNTLVEGGHLTKPATGSWSGDVFQGWGAGSGTANFLGHIVDGIGWAAFVVGVIQLVGSLIGESAEPYVTAASWGAGAGIIAGKLTYGLIKSGGWLDYSWKYPTLFSIGIGLAVGAGFFYFTYEEKSYKIVTFTCYPWDAPTGGNDCEECNMQGVLPCSEYQCRSLGQSCQLLNSEESGEAKCAWINRHDVEYPIIEAWDYALLDGYYYSPDDTISPPDRGVKIIYSNSTTGCVPAYTPLQFGVDLNEPGKCKIDYTRKDTFDEMSYYFGGSSLFRYNHTQTMSLPGATNSENISISNGGEYSLYTRCQDANGNYNTATFVFKFCVEEGPDTTAPLIVTTSLLNNMPFAYNQTEISLIAYVNEPAECKWSHTDQSYDNMEEQMSCASDSIEMNSQMLYECSTTLTGLNDGKDNNFYFRCKDQPSAPDADRNVNAESYKFTLKGTQPLVIDSVGPNETIRDSTDSVKVTLTARTSAGYNDGDATCYYSETGNDDDYTMFYYATGSSSYTHSQELWLGEGDYSYSIKCVDLGGNYDTENVSFSVESDSDAPVVVRVYHEETRLKIVTNEEGSCVYDTTDCSYQFKDGTNMAVVDEVNNYVDWNPEATFYIKCEDKYGNQPAPDECSIIAKPFEIY